MLHQESEGEIWPDLIEADINITQRTLIQMLLYPIYLVHRNTWHQFFPSETRPLQTSEKSTEREKTGLKKHSASSVTDQITLVFSPSEVTLMTQKPFHVNNKPPFKKLQHQHMTPTAYIISFSKVILDGTRWFACLKAWTAVYRVICRSVFPWKSHRELQSWKVAYFSKWAIRSEVLLLLLAASLTCISAT